MKRRTAALILLAVAVAAGGILAYRTFFPDEASLKDRKFLKDVEWLHQQEALANDRFNALYEKSKGGELPNAAFAAALTQLIVPAWHEMHTRISEDTLDPQSSLADQYAYYTRYTALSEEAFGLMGRGLQQGDLALVEQAQQRLAERKQLGDGRGQH